MSDPCSKESVLITLQVRQAEIAGDVQHIKTRIDNGMSHTIADIHNMLIEMRPKIDHHADIVRRIEDTGWLISRVTISCGITIFFGLIIWAASRGFVPKV